MMRKIMVLLMLAGIFSGHSGDAGDLSTATSLDFDILPFENRAACAVDSKQPTQSAFLVVDAYNAGKQINSWMEGTARAGGTGLKVRENMSVEWGLKLFRLSLTEVWLTITRELLDGRLPLLGSKLGEENVDPLYAAVQKKCGKRFPCVEMDQYLSRIFGQWSRLEADEGESRQERLHSDSICMYLKRFSELQSYWNHDRPDQALLQKIALASLAKKDLFTDCFDTSDSLSSRRFILQLDVTEAGPRRWRKIGFDFWNSQKLYFSYAWRHPELILDSAHPLQNLFKNLAIEQMVQLVSTGCQSIERPECSQSQVSMEIYRGLGKMGSSTELDKPLSDRPEQVLLRDPLALHREDAAIFPEHEETEHWLKGYQERVIQRRGFLKQRLLLALSQFELLSVALTPGGISKELSILKKGMKQDPVLYKKMQVMCSEIDVAARPDVNLLEKRFETTLQSEKFKNLVEAGTDQQLKGMIAFYQGIAKASFGVCEQIRNEKAWKADVAVDVSAYSAWFRDLSGKWDAPVHHSEEKRTVGALAEMGDAFNQSTRLAAKFLSQEKITSSGAKEKKVVCTDASDCVRMLLKSMVDLYVVSAWADAMMSMSEWIQSPNLANPWAAATACKIYDPWFATRQAWAGLVTDLITTVVSGVAPVPAYLAVQPRFREVKAFEMDPKGDELFLRPIKNGPAADVSIGIDLGPWTGIPCAAFYSPTSTRPVIGGYYSVLGIRGETCSGKDNNRLVVNQASSPGVNEKHTYSGCAMCYLNPYSAVNSAAALTSLVTPGVKIAAGTIMSGILLAKRLSNRTDVPRRYKVDLNEVAETFERYSFIPKHCVRRLSKGKACSKARLTRAEKDQSPVGEEDEE